MALLLVGVMGILALWCASFTIVAYRDWSFICENTGSRMGYREFWFGLRTGNWYRASEVEMFMRQKFPSELQHRWTSYAGTGRNIYGVKLLHGHGRPGPILQLKEEWLEEWFTPLPDNDKKAFYDLLTRDDDELIKNQVEEIVDDLLSKRRER